MRTDGPGAFTIRDSQLRVAFGFWGLGSGGVGMVVSGLFCATPERDFWLAVVSSHERRVGSSEYVGTNMAQGSNLGLSPISGKCEGPSPERSYTPAASNTTIPN